MPKRNTYRPNVEPIHYSDLAIAERLKSERKAVRKANRVYHRSQAKINPQPVVLRKADGSTRITFNHASAITARVVQQPRALSKKVDIALATAEPVRAKPGTFYTLERPTNVEPVAPVLVSDTVEPLARTRDVATFLAILDRLSPSRDFRPGLDHLDTLREAKREQGTDI